MCQIKFIHLSIFLTKLIWITAIYIYNAYCWMSWLHTYRSSGNAWEVLIRRMMIQTMVVSLAGTLYSLTSTICMKNWSVFFYGNECRTFSPSMHIFINFWYFYASERRESIMLQGRILYSNVKINKQGLEKYHHPTSFPLL